MLNRRHLRIKILHAVYAYLQSQNSDLVKGEKELKFSIEKFYEMYLYLLAIFIEIHHAASLRVEEGKKKRLPTPEDLNPNLKFIRSGVFKMILNNRHLKKELENKKISWANHEELVRKVYKNIRESEDYEKYMNSGIRSIKEDKNFFVEIFKKFIANEENIHHFFEERSIYWNDDLDLVSVMIINTIRAFKIEDAEDNKLFSLYKEDDDEKYVKVLFRKTILEKEENLEIIEAKITNWELDRIALMDRLIMCMALSEATNFPGIPLKVTLNEYIEISKFYSTPKSAQFINGILDKITQEFKKSGKIQKTGRGLME